MHDYSLVTFEHVIDKKVEELSTAFPLVEFPDILGLILAPFKIMPRNVVILNTYVLK